MEKDKVNELNLCIAMVYYIIGIMPEEKLNLEEIVKILDKEMDIVEKNIMQFPTEHPAKIYYDKLSNLKKEEFDNVVTNLKNKIIKCKDDKIFHNAIMILSNDNQVIGLANCIIEYKEEKNNNEVYDRNIKTITIQNGNYIFEEVIQIEKKDGILKCNYNQTKNMLSENPIKENKSFEISKEESQKIYNLMQKINFDSIISNDDYLEGGAAGKIVILYEDGNTFTKEFGAYMPDDINELYKTIRLFCDNEIKRQETLKIVYTYPVSYHIIENVGMVCQENPEFESFFAYNKKYIIEEIIEAKDIATIKGKKISEYLATFKSSDEFYSIVVAMGEASIYNRNFESKDNKLVFSMELDNLELFRAVLVYNIIGILYNISTEGLPIIVEIIIDKKFKEIFEAIVPILNTVQKVIKGIEEFKIIYK